MFPLKKVTSYKIPSEPVFILCTVGDRIKKSNKKGAKAVHALGEMKQGSRVTVSEK